MTVVDGTDVRDRGLPARADPEHDRAHARERRVDRRIRGIHARRRTIEASKTFGVERRLKFRRGFREAAALPDEAGRPTLWDSVIYDADEMRALNDDLRRIYALLKVDGDLSVISHVYVDRIDFCTFGNSTPFRIRIVNAYNDNQDYFYVKRADASRVHGLELEHVRRKPDDLARYIGLALWPHPLVFDYGAEAQASLAAVAPQAILVGGLVLSTLVALVRAPQWAFLGVWFLAMLAPTSLIPGNRQTIAEHRMYLPLATVAVALVVAPASGWFVVGLLYVQAVALVSTRP